jgi:hypothetical protein
MADLSTDAVPPLHGRFSDTHDWRWLVRPSVYAQLTSDPAFDGIVWRDRHPIASGMVVPYPAWPSSMADPGEAVTVTPRRAPLPPPGST